MEAAWLARPGVVTPSYFDANRPHAPMRGPDQQGGVIRGDLKGRGLRRTLAPRRPEDDVMIPGFSEVMSAHVLDLYETPVRYP